jgi:DNA repair protein RadD
VLRDYQQRTIDQLYAWFEAGEPGNPCLVLPTGSGKSHIVAALCKDALQNWPRDRGAHADARQGAD